MPKLGPNSEIYNRPRTAFGPVLPDEKPFLEAYNTLHLNDWRAEEVDRDLKEDELAWPGVPKQIKLLLTNILAFFLHADDIVGDMAKMFDEMIDNPIISAFLTQQAANEIVHQQTYFLMVQRIFEKNDHATMKSILNREDIFQGSTAYKKKLDWAERWVRPNGPVHPCEQLIAFGMTEGVLFASSFASIFFTRSLQGKRKCNLHGLFIGNELVMQDENQHFSNTAAMFRALDPEDRIPVSRIHEIIRSAVDTEDAFIDEIIHDDILGLDRAGMKQYVRWVADFYTQLLGVEKVYNVKRISLDYMLRLWTHERHNPFERKSAAYAKHMGRLSASSSDLRSSTSSVSPLGRSYESDEESAALGSPSSSEEYDEYGEERSGCKDVLELCDTFDHLGLSTDF